MPRFAWVLNQDAELELARPGYNPSAQLKANLERHGAEARALLGPNDVWLQDVPAAQAKDFVGRAWCPTPRALALLQATGVTPEAHPSANVLRQVNHRLFAHELGGGLPHQHYVTDSEPVAALLQTPRKWLLKRPMAFAGRGQLRVQGALDAKQSDWVNASLRRDGLIMEPFVKPLLETSLHGFVWQNRRHELGRPCVQSVDERGVYRGVRLAMDGELSSEESEALFSQAHSVAIALGKAGYFGPFGIDAYRYQDGNEQGFCALGEINARYTMAFATGFPRPSCELRL